jgi:hypothetical protein
MALGLVREKKKKIRSSRSIAQVLLSRTTRTYIAMANNDRPGARMALGVCYNCTASALLAHSTLAQTNSNSQQSLRFRFNCFSMGPV